MEEYRLLLELWERIENYISNSHKNDAAESIILAFIAAGVEADELVNAEGEFDHLDRAIEKYKNEELYLDDDN